MIMSTLALLSSMLIVFSSETVAFNLDAPFAVRKNPSHRMESSFCMSSSHDFTIEEVQEMDQLVMALSLENDDESRRKKVSTLFAEELAKPNGYPRRFTELFDSVLMTAGERVQNEARMAAAKQCKEQGLVDISSNADIDEAVYVPREKSVTELQLWAFIDMMVQTKTLVKKAMGELGSEGSFT